MEVFLTYKKKEESVLDHFIFTFFKTLILKPYNFLSK